MKSSGSIPSALDPRVDRYIAEAPQFARPILTRIRELVHTVSPEVEELIKWGRPFFMHRGVMLGNMAAFKAHCSFGFWGKEMAATLQADGIERNASSGSFGRLTSLEDLPPAKVLLGYLKLAIISAESPKGSRLMPEKRAKRGEAEPPPELVAALDARQVAKRNFARLSPSCRREYIEWITQAKRRETRQRRIAATIAQVAEGKALHAKYAQVFDRR